MSFRGIMLFVFAVVLLGSTTSVMSQEATTAGTYNEGLALLKAKDYEGGLIKMEKAIEMATADSNDKILGLAQKNGAVAIYNIANTKRKAGAHDEAIMMYEKGIAMNPSYSSNYEGVARAQEAKGDKVTAVKSYILAAQKAAEEGKDSKVVSRYKKAQTLVGKTYVAKDYEKAIEMANAYNEAKPDNADVNYYLSRALAESGDLPSALSAMKKAVELSGDAVPDKFTFYLAEQLEKSGNKAEAAATYRKVSEEKYKAQAEYRAGQLEG